MDPTRKLSLLAGWFFIATFVTAIAGDVLYGPVLDDARYVVGAGADSRIGLGALLEMLLILTNLGTAVALFPVLKRQSEAGALGYVTARVVECTFIAIGIVAVLGVVTLRQDGGGDEGALLAAAHSLVAVKDWTFLLGPGFVVGLGNGLLLGWLMYRSGLVPRRMALLGLVGGPLAFLSGVAVLLDVIEAGSAAQFVMTILEIAWEASLGIYLVWKGFRRDAPILANAPVVVPEVV
jgi:hypothetical protein